MKRDLNISRYTYQFVSSEKKNLIYNSRSNSFLEVSNKLYSLLLECKKDRNNIKLFSEETVDFLVDRKFIVEKNEDDDFLLNLQHKTDSRTYSTSVLNLTIVPTLGCNFSCFYCFEENKRPITMDEKNINAVISFINMHTESRQLQLTWYGGEPLIATKVIKSLLDKISTETKIKLKCHNLITNGYYFNDKAIELFHQYPLNYIQITLDGKKERHDAIRKTKAGLPSYDTIIKNAERILNEFPNIELHFRINIENKNKNDYHIVAKELSERWKGKNIHIYPGFLRIDNSKKTTFSCAGLNQKEIAEFTLEMKDNHTYDISLYPQLLNDRTCCATQKNSYIIGPKGEIYKCWTDVSNPQKIVGDIHTNKITNKPLLNRYLVASKWYNDSTCKKCFFLPICNGPCAWYALRNKYEKGNYDLCSCIEKVPGMLNKCLEYYYNTQRTANNH